MQWDSYLPHTFWNLINPKTYIRNLRYYTKKQENYFMHHLPRLPNLSLGYKRYSFSTYRINHLLMNMTINKICESFGINVIVTGHIGEHTPLPSIKKNVPIIIDYVDWPHWSTNSERKNLQKASAVIAVSEILYERAKNLNINTYLIPNGADIDKFSKLNGYKAKMNLGLVGWSIVSIIGLTYSSLYFIDAILLAKKKIPNLKCILVGKSDHLKNYLQNNRNLFDTFIYVGPVPYDEIGDYYAASDVGLYPVDETLYYDAASPIKIFEYTAAHKPVVLPRIKEMMRIGFPNLIFAAPTKESFAEAIIEALKRPVSFSEDIKNYDWQIWSSNLEKILLEQIEKNRY